MDLSSIKFILSNKRLDSLKFNVYTTWEYSGG